MFTDGVRRWITSGSLVLFPVLLFFAFLTSPSDQNHEPHIFRAQAAKVEISAVFFHWSVIVMAFAIIGLAWAARTRALTQTGAVLGLVGAVSGGGLFIADFYDLATAQNLTDEQAVAVTQAVDGYAGYVYGFVFPSFLLHIGVLCLLIALVRDKAVPVWVPVLMLAGVFFPFFTVEQEPVVQSAGPLLQLVACGMVAVRLLRAPRVQVPQHALA
ncbi:hypothetical protein ABGB12_19275 [Actinocorallia sp. B10E7]|uniref:hypothetical protein n=1 Tax=Actinocorallia sp. B10E7 TaxID=3153558 RepID=UPI00325EC15B